MGNEHTSSAEELLDREFQLRSGLIHLNHAGVAPWPTRTARAVQRFAEENVRQSSCNYAAEWLGVEAELRAKAALLMNAPSAGDIALLKNTSEALSVVAYGIDWRAGDNIVSSDQEFPSNRIVWESLAACGVELREADLASAATPEGALFALVDGRTRLVTISSVQFGTGLRMDLSRIGELCRKRGILFCIDAIQSLGAAAFDVREVEADFVMADGHKWMLGPEGLALFYARPGARDRLRLTQYGWHMVDPLGDFDTREWSVAKTARRFECGSPNMLGIHGLDASLSLLLETGMEEVERRVSARAAHLFDRIRSEAALELVTPGEPGRSAGIVTFRLRDTDPAPLYRHLMQHDVLCALRSGGIRLSPHFYTPLDQLDHVMAMIADYLKRV
ncbi:MAG: aminotransferase class V-fold PLP-dependent enzyme [Nitrospirota bacterium]